MSAVRNVADFGHPSAGPVHASTSSMVMSSSAINRNEFMTEKVPMRLAIKFGVSFATTTPLPRITSQKLESASVTSGSVSVPGITSTSFMYRGGLKKCVPAQWRRKSSLRPSAMRFTGKPEVFVVTSVPGLRCFSIFSSSARLISKFSATTSTIQSACAHQSRLSSKLPIWIRFALSAVKKAAGRDFKAASIPARANRLRTSGLCKFRPRAFSTALNSGGTMSSRKTGTPALAKCAAMRAPMVPAPRTATR